MQWEECFFHLYARPVPVLHASATRSQGFFLLSLVHELTVTQCQGISCAQLPAQAEELSGAISSDARSHWISGTKSALILYFLFFLTVEN